VSVGGIYHDYQDDRDYDQPIQEHSHFPHESDYAHYDDSTHDDHPSDPD
jgi:hypothetical protein